MEAARVGDVGASQQRFRDPECFIPDQKASRYEEKDFAVNRDKDAMASAVLDLQQDDAVSVATALHTPSHLDVMRTMHTISCSSSLHRSIQVTLSWHAIIKVCSQVHAWFPAQGV